MPETDLERLLASTAEPVEFAAVNGDASVMVADSDFAPFEGRTPATRHARICLSLGPAAQLYYRDDHAVIEGVWRPGEVTISLPGLEGECRSQDMHVMGLAIDLDRYACEECRMLADDLANAARGFTSDPFIASAIAALRHGAEWHGASGAFFDHGVEMILARLALLNGRMPDVERAHVLSAARLRAVDTFIDANLSADINVESLARVCGMSRSAFARSFRKTAGVTPYAHLTRRRMERAQAQIREGRAVTEIALNVGYANPGKFAEAFRRACGMSPSAWRREAG